MPTISEQLTQLISDRDDLVDNLTSKGITGLTGDETFTELVPEVLNISSGGALNIQHGIIPKAVDEDGYVSEVEICDLGELSNRFSYDTKLRKVKITNGITTIKSSAFSNCVNLTNAEISDNVTSIEMYAFSNCSNLRSVNIPINLTIINQQTFNGCTNLTNIEIPNSVTRLALGAFQYCKSLVNIHIPANLTIIDDYVFRFCDSLESITVDENNTNFKSFDGILCNKSTSFQNVSKIFKYPDAKADNEFISYAGGYSKYAFSNNQNLKVIYFNYSYRAMSIAEGLFMNSSNLEKIILRNTYKVVSLSNINAFTGTKIANGEGYIYVPDNYVDSYKSATNWSTFAEQIKPLSELEE